MKKIVAIDAGKHSCKAAVRGISDEIKRVSFRNKITKLYNFMDIDIHGDSFLVDWESSRYIIGQHAEDSSYNISKTELQHKLAAYIAVTQLCDTGTMLRLVVGCPASIYLNRTMKQELKEYIFNGGRFDVTVNGLDYSYEVENVLVVPEGSGAIYAHPGLFDGKRVCVIDLGGLNFNFTIYENLIPVISSMFATNQGSSELEAMLTTELGYRYGLSLSRSDSVDILQRGGMIRNGRIDPESVIALQQVKQEYVDKIVKEIQRHNFNIDLFNVVVIGGTANHIKEQLLERIPHAYIVESPEICNVVGFLKLGELKYEEQ